jgi:predicted DNA-binding transcriptional regulator YafY
MRADRLLSILLLLQARRRMTARELAQRLEVSERTIHRDMAALSGAGIPVLAERGAGGGWALLGDYRTDLTGLSPAEVRALFVQQTERLAADLGWRKATEAAYTKLLAALPDIHRRDAEFVRQRIHFDPTGWYAAPEDVSALPVLQEALWQARKLWLQYARPDEALVERTVSPLGLVVKGESWYLIAGVEADIRTYRVARIRAAKMLEAPSARPAGFDLAAYWSHSTAEYKAGWPQYPVTVRADREATCQLQNGVQYGRVLHVDPPDPEGWATIQLLFHLFEDAAPVLLGFGAAVEVLAPAELREHLWATAQRMRMLYRSE